VTTKGKKKRASDKDQKRKKKGKATALDIVIGQNLRIRRGLAGLSQEKLGDQVDITFQQIQKNENGTNRVAASRLYEFSQILECDVNDFFDGYDGNYKSKAVKLLHSIPLEVLPLIRKVSNIKDEKRRKKVIKALNELVLQNTE
jgi:transcriptional regulator with XRE-family HTH domain